MSILLKIKGWKVVQPGLRLPICPLVGLAVYALGQGVRAGKTEQFTVLLDISVFNSTPEHVAGAFGSA